MNNGDLVDHFTRESPAIEVARSIPARRVVEVLDRVADERGLPKTIRVDHGTEFTSKILDQWAYANGVELDFTRPGKQLTMRSSSRSMAGSDRSA